MYGALTRGAAVGRRAVVTTAVEHSSVLEAARRSTTTRVTVVGADRRGHFDADELLAAIDDTTALVSIQLANHEVGTIQAVLPIVERVRELGGRQAGSELVVHVDACAAAGHVPVDFAALDADLCSVTGHTWGAPPGAAALFVRRGLRFPPFVLGGSQERGRRGGFEAVPAIVGFGAAAAELSTPGRLATEAAAARELTDRIAAAATAVHGVERYGDPDPTGSLPDLVCLGIEGVEAEPILLALNQHGVAVHSGSSCSSETLEPSPVLQAMGVDADRSLRASVGWCSTAADVEMFAGAFPGIVERLRGLRTP
jgi:cysteine desulfurase